MSENDELKRIIEQKEREERDRDWNRQPSSHDYQERRSHHESESEKNRISSRLRQLEEENDKLSRENYKLKTEKSVTIYNIQNSN